MQQPASAFPLRTLTVSVLAMAVLAACGAGETTSPTQTAARVNKEEITVHQIGALLATQKVAAEQVPAAERQILERLINRELSVQKAVELKLDREPKVVQAIESARQEIIARAYADKLSEAAPRPSAADIKKYYTDHPMLFSERKVYQLQEFAVEADAKQLDTLKAAMPAMKGTDDLAAWLKANNVKFASQQAVRAAEQLPMSLLPGLSRLSEGQALLTPTPRGAQIMVVRAVRAQPVDEERASRAIEQFLINEQKRKLLSDDLKALRAAAKIEYQGRFAASAPAGGDGSQEPSAAEVAASAAATLDPKAVNEAPGTRAAASETRDAPAAAASGIDATTVNKGLGLK
jgi:EpsD family peptidyl-prolyl cis-trans isomerase